MTATKTWLENADWAECALVLVVDGLGIGWTNHDDVAGLSAAWLAAESALTEVKGGLRVEGSIERRIELFDAQIDPSDLTFSILDHDDYLAPLMFGEGRTDIGRTYLTQSVDCDDTTIPCADITQFDLGTIDNVYCGLETFSVENYDDGANTLTVTRGHHSIFSRIGFNNFAWPHEVPSNGGPHPEVTDTPTNWLNRQVGLYICHRVNGEWSAGFPETVTNDAELLWAGRIKHWAEDGTGWITLDCTEITEMLQTTIGARLMSGRLREGRFIAASEAGLRTYVAYLDPPGGGTYSNNVNTSLTAIADQYVTHEQIVEAINAELSARFIEDPGTYGPSTGRMWFQMNPVTSTYEVIWQDTSPGTTAKWTVVLTVSDTVWDMLGFGSNTLAPHPHFKIVDNAELDASKWNRLQAPAPPWRFRAPGGGTWSIGDDGLSTTTTESIITLDSFDNAFVPQDRDRLPPGLPADTDGFLAFDDVVIAVHQINAYEFAYRDRFDGLDKRSAGGLPDGAAVDASSTGELKVRQVWIEYGTLLETMLRLVLSTGTEGFNHATYDQLPAAMGCGFPSSLVDLGSFFLFGNMPYLLFVKEPTPLVKLLESALNLTGRQAVWSSG